MEFELALRLPSESVATVLPLRLAYRQGIVLVLDNVGGLKQLAEDWEAANDLAGVTGRIVHWYEGHGLGKSGTFGFETILLNASRRATEQSVWLTFSEFCVPSIDVTLAPERSRHDLAMPMSGAEFVRGRCPGELKAIQDLLRESHPSEIEDDIKEHAPWLNVGGAMITGSQISINGEDIAEEAVVFDYPDQSQMAVTAQSIYLSPVTFARDDSRRMHWGQYGRA